MSFKISLKFVPKGPTNNIPALVQKMAWCRPGDRPWPDSILVSLQLYSNISVQIIPYSIAQARSISHCGDSIATHL